MIAIEWDEKLSTFMWHMRMSYSPVITGVFQYAASLATPSNANAQAGPIKAITLSWKCKSASDAWIKSIPIFLSAF